MKTQHFIPFLLLAVIGCSGRQVTYYADGNPQSRVFSTLLKQPALIDTGYYKVIRNGEGRIVEARYLQGKGNLVSVNGYKYDRKGTLILRRETTYFAKGPPQLISDWEYKDGKLLTRTDQWYTHGRSFEKRIVTHFDARGRPYLEETLREGLKLTSDTEFYYDYRGNLDKSQRNFYLPDGELRDYWITIYDDQERIIREEHYLPNNTLVAFYRYQYNPAFGYLEMEEILDENRQEFIRRSFNKSNMLLREEHFDRQMNSLGFAEYEYTEGGKPLNVHYHNKKGKLTHSEKYDRPLVQEGFRRPE